MNQDQSNSKKILISLLKFGALLLGVFLFCYLVHCFNYC